MFVDESNNPSTEETHTAFCFLFFYYTRGHKVGISSHACGSIRGDDPDENVLTPSLIVTKVCKWRMIPIDSDNPMTRSSSDN